MYKHNNTNYVIAVITATTTATPLRTLLNAALVAASKTIAPGTPIRTVLRCAGAALTLTCIETGMTFTLAQNVEKLIDTDILDSVAISVAAATQAVTLELYNET